MKNNLKSASNRIIDALFSIIIAKFAAKIKVY